MRVQITKTKNPWTVPHYRIMSDVDLEVGYFLVGPNQPPHREEKIKEREWKDLRVKN